MLHIEINYHFKHKMELKNILSKFIGYICPVQYLSVWSNLVHESSVSDDPAIPSGFVIYWLVADLSTCPCSWLYLLVVTIKVNSLELIKTV